MPKTVQLRNVPEELHKTLKSRAAAAGMSPSAYLRVEFRQIAEVPTVDELRESAHDWNSANSMK
jgi:plasmid stability protein